MLVCPQGQMGALEARPPGLSQGQRRALSTWPRLSAGPQDASQGRRLQAPVRWVRLQAGPYYDAGPSCAWPGQARGQPPVSPQRFSTQGYVKRVAVMGGGLMTAQDHVLTRSPATACPLRP